MFQQLEVELPSDARNFQLRVLALCLADRLEEARRVIPSRFGRVRDVKQDREFWNFLDADYAVGTPFSP